MNWWELLLIVVVVLTVLAAKYRFDPGLMPREKKALLRVWAFFVVLYVAYMLVFKTLA